MLRTYSELIQIDDFYERFNYLRLNGVVGEETFGFDRYLNQEFYRSEEWKAIRREVIVRDNGFEMAHPDYEISGRVYIHHMNPVSQKDISNRSDLLLDQEYLVCVSFMVHQAIHYGDESLLPRDDIVERFPGDTKLW